MANFEKLYYINAGENGSFKPSGTPATDTAATDIDALFSYLEEKGQQHLLLYFHGGLVKNNNGMVVAQCIHDYAQRCASPSHPVSFVWETGLQETISQNITTIGQSDFFKSLLVKIIKIAGKQLGIYLQGAGLVSRGVDAMTDEDIRHELNKPAPFEDTVVNQGKRAATLNVPHTELHNDNYYNNVIMPEVLVDVDGAITNDPVIIALAQKEKPTEEAALMPSAITAQDAEGCKGILSLAALIKAAVEITMAVIKRHMRKRDHGFYPTIIEEVLRKIYIANAGSWVWGSMKKKAANMWQADDFTGDPQNWRAGSYFLKKLDEYQRKNGPLLIDIAGHSAGAVVICELVKAVKERYAHIQFRNIVFMAPACTCSLFSETILQSPAQYKQFRCFTMVDAYEIKDHLVPLLYPRSLLYLISGILEGDDTDVYILGLQRHISGNEPYNREEVLNKISAFMSTENNIVYSVTQDAVAEGLRTAAQHHGDFDNDGEATMDSLFYIINTK